MGKAVNGRTLSAGDAEAVLRKNIANIVKKASAGKPLTSRELAIIERYRDPAPGDAPSSLAQEFVTSYAHLGKIFGPHGNSFKRWKRELKDAPDPLQNGLHSVAAWRGFFSKHPELLNKTKGASERPAAGPQENAGDDENLTESEYRRRKTREQWLRMKQEREKNAELYYLRSDVDAWIRDRIEKVKQVLQNSLKNVLPPRLEGLTATAMMPKMDPVIAEVIAAFRNLPPAAK